MKAARTLWWHTLILGHDAMGFWRFRDRRDVIVCSCGREWS